MRNYFKIMMLIYMVLSCVKGIFLGGEDFILQQMVAIGFLMIDHTLLFEVRK